MNNVLVTMMIAILLLKAKGVEPQASEHLYSSFTYYGQEYTVEELELPSGSQVKPIQGWYINGYHMIPKEVRHKGAVVVFGGTDGGCDFGSALPLAYEGYEVYVMFFYGQKNQRKDMSRVPLEFFAELYLYIQKTAQSPKPLTIHGYSKGTELALLLASYFPKQVDHLILYAPASYVFEGSGRRSSWSFQGKELPFISLQGNAEVKKKLDEAFRNNKPRRGIELYQYGLKHDKNKEKARINLAPIQAKMLIFAGELDEAGPAADMAREIKANYEGACELVIFEKAGHFFSEETVSEGWAMGGDPEANVEAKVISDRIRLKKLAEWTK